MPNCYNCGSNDFKSGTVHEIFKINGKLVLVENIPVQICNRCGETLFSSETAEKIRIMLQNPTEPVKTIQVDVFAYQS